MYLNHNLKKKLYEFYISHGQTLSPLQRDANVFHNLAMCFFQIQFYIKLLLYLPKDFLPSRLILFISCIILTISHI